MKCQKCGADIPDGELFCKECGAEVQLVPDYNSVEYLLQYKRNAEQKERQRQIDEEMAEPEKKKKKRKHPVLITLGVILGLAVLGVLIYFMIDYRNSNSFEYQYSKAQEAYGEQDYAKASAYIERALYLQPDHVDAELLSVEIMLQTEDARYAVDSLTAIIYNHPDNAAAYEKILGIYEAEGDTESIKELMDDCGEESIRSQFAAYICEPPVIKTAEGNYKYKIKAEVEAHAGKLYYTTDGTLPTDASTEYTEPVEMPEGKTTFQVVAYNEKGIPSEVASHVYTVTLARPNPPAISPASGTYEAESKITVTVPAGCKAYYVFDGTASASGNLYTEPVTMRNGEHIFSVILIDGNGKESYPASQTYIVSE